jgi:hypothetical protein
MKSETQTLAEQDDERYARNTEVFYAVNDSQAKGWKQLLRKAALLCLITDIQYGGKSQEELADLIKTIIE